MRFSEITRRAAFVYHTSRAIGYAAIFFGLLIFFDNAGFVEVSWELMWPLAIVCFGVYVVFALEAARRLGERLVERLFGRL